MIGRRALMAGLARDIRGAMAVETALVAPVLALMALGTYDVSKMVSKQQDLQSGASEATQIVLAAASGEGVSSDTLKSVIESSLNLGDDQVTLVQKFRCDAAAQLVDSAASCTDASKPIYKYVQMTLTDSYTPLWTNFGVGHTINYSLVRTVEIA